MNIEKKLDAIAETIMETDEEENAATEKPANDVDPVRIVEAMLFSSAEPLSPHAMHERLPEGTDLGAIMEQLQAKYDGAGVTLTQVGKNWAFRTAVDVAGSLTVEKAVERKLSKAALETLAILAYHQPITRAEIENIRGVATHKGTLDTLMEMGWVKPGRRRETPGRPLTWVTTDGFLDHFQLESLRDLPGLDDLKASGLLDTRPAIETIPDTRDLFDDADVDAAEVLDEQEGDEAPEEAYDMPADMAEEEE